MPIMGFGAFRWVRVQFACEIQHPETPMGGRNPSPTPHHCWLYRKPSTPGVVLPLDVTFQLVSVEVDLPEVPGGIAFGLVVEMG